MIYDCIIAGGGPAGSVCSLLLQARGLSCLILEKRSVIDEKVCGGFVPDRCRNLLLECGADLSEMTPSGNRIEGYMESREGVSRPYFYKDNRYGLGVSRKDLDSFLLKRTAQAGTKIVFGETVSDCEKEDGRYRVNGFYGKKVVWATGAVPPPRCKAFDGSKVREAAKKRSAGISEIIQAGSCDLNSHMVYFWYEKESNDYFWAIPTGADMWNIGYWTRENQSTLKQKFLAERRKRIGSCCENLTTLRPPRGALLGNADFSACLSDPDMFCCGDLSGTDNILTGEGIAQAVVSAKKTADAVIRSLNGGNMDVTDL